MVVDTSALCAVLFHEPDAEAYAQVLTGPDRKLLSAVSALEAGIVVEARWGEAGAQALLELMEASAIDVVALDASLAEVVLDVWRRYGKGRHPAGLNLGDCASYALAKVSHQPLLFKGEDFGRTDLPVLARDAAHFSRIPRLTVESYG